MEENGNGCTYKHLFCNGSDTSRKKKITQIKKGDSVQGYVFDALLSKRCYKEAFTYDKAFSIIEDGLGTQFDPVLSRIFLECRSELEELYDSLLEQ